MNELIAQLNEWRAALRQRREALRQRLPRWWGRALAVILIAIAIVLPFFFAPASGFLNAVRITSLLATV